MIFDLHTHTTMSDGSLTPRELVARAIDQGVDVLAVTDHDTLDAYRDIPQRPEKLASGTYIGRPHFAQFLVNTGKVTTIQAAFKKYLGAGKPGDVKQHWANLAQIINWIRAANGIAVLAHPLKYKLTRTKLKRFLDHFISLGG